MPSFLAEFVFEPGPSDLKFSVLSAVAHCFVAGYSDVNDWYILSILVYRKCMCMLIIEYSLKFIFGMALISFCDLL